MRRLALAIVVAIFTSVPPAGAETCVSPAAIASANSRIPGLNVKRLTGEEAARFVAGFNAMPPATDLAADEVLLLRAPGIPTAFVALSLRGCVVSSGELDLAVVAQIEAGRFGAI